jgi:hypothetical protein
LAPTRQKEDSVKKDQTIKMEPLLARRILHVEGAPQREVTISIGLPRHLGTYWQCPFLVERDGNSEVQTVGGEDALQALLVAINCLRNELDKTGLPLIWMSPELGADIPRFVPMGYGREFERRLDGLIEHEINRFWRYKLNIRREEIAKARREIRSIKATIRAREVILNKQTARLKDWESRVKARKVAKNSA